MTYGLQQSLSPSLYLRICISCICNLVACPKSRLSETRSALWPTTGLSPSLYLYLCVSVSLYNGQNQGGGVEQGVHHGLQQVSLPLFTSVSMSVSLVSVVQ